jgi:hypothetical protein
MYKLLLVLLLPFCALSQHGFKANNNRVEWTEVYNDSVSVSKIETQLRTKLNHKEEINITQSSISGTTEFMPLITNLEDMAPAFRQPVSFNYRVDFKDGRYKVFINNIVFDGIIVTVYGVTNKNDLYADTDLIRSRDGDLRKNKQAQRVFERLHNAFISTFAYTEPEKW